MYIVCFLSFAQVEVWKPCLQILVATIVLLVQIVACLHLLAQAIAVEVFVVVGVVLREGADDVGVFVVLAGAGLPDTLGPLSFLVLVLLLCIHNI